MDYFDYILNISQYILEGAKVSLQIYSVTLVLSIPIGIVCAIGKISKIAPLRWLMGFYTYVLRGTPLLLQLFFIYYGLPHVPVIGVTLTPLTAALLAFVLNYGAYFTEIFRAGIQSIDRGQYEAAKALGLTHGQTMKRIVIPQAFKIVLPPTGNEAITLIKDTALVSVIALADVMRNARAAVSRDFDVTGYIVAAVFYLLFTFVVVNIFRYIEKRWSYYR